MFRPGASRTLLRSFNAASPPAWRGAHTRLHAPITSQLCTLVRRPQARAATKPLTVHWARGAARKDGPPMDRIDTKHEKELAQHVLEADPENVSLDSSIHPVFGEVGSTADKKEEEENMMAGVHQDIQTIKDTFDMSDVPKPALYIGLAGIVPYVATSLSTVFCAYEIHHAHEVGSGLILHENTAELLLHILEPLQIGYGATIISFLGAIHWGLEWAKFGGEQGYQRYSIGVIGTALAWPTILMPVEYALISQFLIFNYMYYKDARATRAGWAPQWYGVYRFALTFIVGAALVISLVGRGQVADRIGRLPGPADRVKQLRDQQAEQFENEEETRRRLLASTDEEEDDE